MSGGARASRRLLMMKPHHTGLRRPSLARSVNEKQSRLFTLSISGSIWASGGVQHAVSQRLPSAAERTSGARVLSHKLANLARLDDEEFDLIRTPSPSRTRKIPGGAPLPDQKRFRRSLVVSGWVGRLNLFADGRGQVISTMVPGELVGSHPNPFITKTTVALVSSQLCDLTPLFDALDQRSGGHVQLRKALALAAHIEEAQLAEQVVRLGRRTAVERLGHWLLDLQHRLAMAGVSQGNGSPCR